MKLGRGRAIEGNISPLRGGRSSASQHGNVLLPSRVAHGRAGKRCDDVEKTRIDHWSLQRPQPVAQEPEPSRALGGAQPVPGASYQNLPFSIIGNQSACAPTPEWNTWFTVQNLPRRPRSFRHGHGEHDLVGRATANLEEFQAPSCRPRLPPGSMDFTPFVSRV